MAAIGIDRYRSGAWPTLQNAVNDARGAIRTFAGLGFERKAVMEDAIATRSAFFRLTDDLKTLSPNDSLVIFFAGHGYTERREFSDGVSARIGYLVPADADGTQLNSCISLDTWLLELARLPPRHVLVILDCCGSGIALAPRYRAGGEGVIGARSRGVDSAVSMEPLRSRQSRRVITSALDEQPALDDGPIPGHSLFTGCLISALSGDLFAQLGRSAAASSELFTHVRDQVWKQSQSKQTPDFGALDRDERGELVLEQSPASTSNPVDTPAASFASGAPGVVRRRLGLDDFRTPMTRVPVTGPRVAAAGTGAYAQATPPAAALAAIDRSSTGRDVSASAASAPGRVANSALERPVEAIPANADPASRQTVDASLERRVKRAAVVAADPDSDEATEPLAARTGRSPRPPRRGTGAVAARHARPSNVPGAPTSPRPAPRPSEAQRGALEPAFVAMLDRHDAERGRGRQVVSVISAEALAATTSWAAWAAGHGKLTLVTGAMGMDGATTELLAAMPWLRLLQAARARIATAAGLDLAALDAALRDAALDDCCAWVEDVVGDEPTARVAGWLLSWSVAPWGSFLDPATAPVQGPALLSMVCELAAPIAVLFHNADPNATWLARALQAARELAGYMPRHAVAVAAPQDVLSRVLDDHPQAGVMKLQRNVVPLARAPRIAVPGGGQLAQLAGAALASDARTAGLFELGVRVPVHDRERPVSVDLFARDAMLAIEIDDWYRSGDPRRYDDDRLSEAQLQHAGFYVLRFAADDIERRHDAFLDEVALALAGRRASGSFMENAHVQHTR